MSVVKEFKEFAMKGNVVDLAVGVIIGAAFGKVVSSLVTDVLMPVLGLIIGSLDFSRLSFVLREGATVDASVFLRYGSFLQALFDFLIVAFAIFMMIKAINRMKRKPEEKPAEPAKISDEVLLLTDILNLLRNKP